MKDRRSYRKLKRTSVFYKPGGDILFTPLLMRPQCLLYFFLNEVQFFLNAASKIRFHICSVEPSGFHPHLQGQP